MSLRPLFRTGRDRSRPVRAQLPVSTREQPERSFRFLETTSRHGTSGCDRSRSVAPCRLCRVDAQPGASDLSANQPLLAHAFLIYFFPFKAHVRFHVSSIDYPNMTFWSKADTRTLIAFGETRVSMMDWITAGELSKSKVLQSSKRYSNE